MPNAVEAIAEHYAHRLSALRARHFEVAEELAMTIARTRALCGRALAIKAELLITLLRPETMGTDQPERHILLSLPGEIRAVLLANNAKH